MRMDKYLFSSSHIHVNDNFSVANAIISDVNSTSNADNSTFTNIDSSTHLSNISSCSISNLSSLSSISMANDESLLTFLEAPNVNSISLENLVSETASLEGNDSNVDHTISLSTGQSNVNNSFYNSKYPEMAKIRKDHPKNIVIAHLNINSLRNKFDEVKCIMRNLYLDIFSVSESKLDESFSNNLFRIEQFNMHRKDRNAHGGGIIVWCRNDLAVRRRPDLETEHIESIVLETHIGKSKWFMIHAYKPPRLTSSTFE